MLQDEANTKRSTPAARASSARRPGLVVDRVGQALVELSERIVRERSQMDDGVHPLDIRRVTSRMSRSQLGRGRRRQRRRSQPS